MQWLREEDGEAYEEMVRARATPWGGTPSQPIGRCVSHLVAIVFREVEEETAGKDDLRITQKEAEAWAKNVGLVER